MQGLHVVVLIFMAESFIYHPMDLSSGATATAADILNGKTAVINGEIVTGTMPNRGNISKNLSAGESYYLSAGYYSGGVFTASNSSSPQEEIINLTGSFVQSYYDSSPHVIWTPSYGTPYRVYIYNNGKNYRHFP